MIRQSRSSAAFTFSCALLFSLLCGHATAQSTITEGDYRSRMFSVGISRPSNWARLPYQVTPLDNQGDRQYDRVLFHVDDFGEFLVVGVRVLPAASLSAMERDDRRTTLRNISQASLMGWRRDLADLPTVTEEEFFDSKYGETIVRVYRATNGSVLTMAQGRRPTAADRFDTNIVSIVARREALVVFVLTQNDSAADDAQALKTKADRTFRSIEVRQ